MLPRAAFAAVVIAAVALCAGPRPAAAQSQGSLGLIQSFTKTSTGSITFAVQNIAAPALAGSQAYGFSLTVQTGNLPGSITLTAPTVTGTAGNSIPRAAFSASCVATLDQSAIFTSLGVVRLGASPVSCGTISAQSGGQLNFNVTLYIDKMASAAGAFSADTYASGLLSVTANAP
jgi:hypothetical protein